MTSWACRRCCAGEPRLPRACRPNFAGRGLRREMTGAGHEKRRISSAYPRQARGKGVRAPGQAQALGCRGGALLVQQVSQSSTYGTKGSRPAIEAYACWPRPSSPCARLELFTDKSLKDVKELIGHGDIRMTDCYSHLSPARKRQAQARFAEHYGKAVAVPEKDKVEAGTT